MGKAAKKRLKRRQDDARAQRRANRNERSALDSAASIAAAGAAMLADVAPADRKAAAARAAEIADSMAAHPLTTIGAAEFARAYARMTDGARHGNAEMRAVYPRMTADVDRVSALLIDQPHSLCEHLDASPLPFAVRCVMCPDNRLLCMECLRDHGSTHERAEEFRCSECMEVDMRGIHGVRPDLTTGVPVQRTGDDRPRPYPGAVGLSGYGVCARCRSKAGKARARQVAR